MYNVKKYIKISADVKKQLAAKYKVSMAAICLALAYEKKEGKSKWIRIDALQMGGVVHYDMPENLLVKVAKGEEKLPWLVD